MLISHPTEIKAPSVYGHDSRSLALRHRSTDGITHVPEHSALMGFQWAVARGRGGGDGGGVWGGTAGGPSRRQLSIQECL